MESMSEEDSDSSLDEELTRDLQSLNELLEGDTSIGGLGMLLCITLKPQT